MLLMTVNSKASDKRDKIFGLLGMLETSRIRPDYSLSISHVMIGIFSHILLNLGDIRVLLDAGGLRSNGTLPSWVPLLDEIGTGTSHIEYLVPNHKRSSVFEFDTLSPRNTADSKDTFEQFFSSHTSSWADLLNQKRVDKAKERLQAWQRLRWSDHAFVNALSGSLVVNAQHICRIDSISKHTWSLGEEEIYPINNDSHILITEKIRSSIVPLHDHIFFLHHEGEDGILLILRQVDGFRDFQVIGNCKRMYLRRFGRFDRDLTSDRRDMQQILLENLYMLPPRYLNISDYWMESLQQVFPTVFLKKTVIPDSSKDYIPGNKDEQRYIPTIFSLVQGMLNEERRTRPNLEDMYVAFQMQEGLSPEFSCDDKDVRWTSLKLSPEIWAEASGHIIATHWRYGEDLSWTSFSERAPKKPLLSSWKKTIHVRAPWQEIHGYIRRMEFFRRTCDHFRSMGVMKWLPTEGLDELAIHHKVLEWRSHHVPQSSIRYPPASNSLLTDYGTEFDWGIYRIQIV